MRNYRICGMQDGRMPMTMPDPTDFGDSKYDSIALYHTVDGMPVVIRRSIAITPMRGVCKEEPVQYFSAPIRKP